MKKAEKTILLVEDNRMDEVLTLRALKNNNLIDQIVVARDGVEALDYLFATGRYAGRSGGLPDLVLLDLKLPKLDGIEVLRRLRAENATRLLPVVMLTSSREDGDLMDSYGSGCNSYVRKPVDFNEFAEAVKQLGIYWLMLNEHPPLVALPE